MTNKDFPIGTRVYYSGDMANFPWFGTVVERGVTQFGEYIKITTDEGKTGMYSPVLFSEKYSGNGSTRFVTEKAYKEWRMASMRAMGI